MIKFIKSIVRVPYLEGLLTAAACKRVEANHWYPLVVNAIDYVALPNSDGVVKLWIENGLVFRAQLTVESSVGIA